MALYFRIYLSEIKGLSILKGVIACVLGMMQDICFFMEYKRMKTPHSAMFTCNDGFRSEGFLLEVIDEEA